MSTGPSAGKPMHKNSIASRFVANFFFLIVYIMINFAPNNFEIDFVASNLDTKLIMIFDSVYKIYISGHNLGHGGRGIWINMNTWNSRGMKDSNYQRIGKIKLIIFKKKKRLVIALIQ